MTKVDHGVVITFRLEAPLKKLLTKIAEHEGRTVANCCWLAVKEWIAKKEKEIERQKK